MTRSHVNWRSIARNWKSVVLVFLAGLLGGVLHLVLVGSTYHATARILISPLPDQPGLEGTSVLLSSSDLARTLQTAVGLIDTEPAAQRTAQHLGGTWRAEEVAERTRVEVIGQSNIIAVEGSGSSPEEAAQLADVFARSAIEIRYGEVQGQAAAKLAMLRLNLRATAQEDRDLSAQVALLSMIEQNGDPSMSLAQLAQPPTRPAGLPPAARLVLAAVLGLILGVFLAFIRSMRDPLVAHRRDIEESLPWPILATVRIDPDGTPHDGIDARQMRLLGALLDRPQEQVGTILVTEATAGDGCSIVAHGLARAEVDAGNSVLLLGGDQTSDREPSQAKPQAPARAIALPAAPAGVARGVAAPWLVLQDPAGRAVDVPDVSPGSLAQNSCHSVPRRELPAILEDARSKANRVIVDGGPLADAELALGVAASVDAIIVVLRLGHTRRADIHELRELLPRLGRTTANLVVLADEPNRPSRNNGG